MKKTLRAALLGLLMTLPCAALADTAQQLVVTLTDHSTHTFWLSEEPHVTFGATNLTVKSSTTTYTVERNEVLTFTFTAVEAEGIHAAGTITTANGVSRLYDLNGRLLQEEHINTATLPAGTYILQSPGKQTVKIQKH